MAYNSAQEELVLHALAKLSELLSSLRWAGTGSMY